MTEIEGLRAVSNTIFSVYITSCASIGLLYKLHESRFVIEIVFPNAHWYE